MKRWIALILVFALLPIPGAFAAGVADREQSARLITETDYAAVDAMWQELEAAEERAVRSHKSAMEAVASAVEENSLYREGTLRWQGTEHFTFETTVGVTCAWSMRIKELSRSVTPWEGEKMPGYVRSSYGTSYTATGRDVYVFQPYYGIDSSFTTQYQTEGQAIAAALGSTCHLYTQTAATVDAIADAMEQGAVVIFDSHGDTDYARGEDYTSGATTSYLLLQTGAGLTEADYANDNGTYHAYYYGKYQSMYYYAVDGTCIANHMEKAAPDNLLWMAICLSMATDGLHAPLMEKGVAVAYGYSQSVTFGGDYCWEACFWNEMRTGAQVKEAVAEMKERYGAWDCSVEIYEANGWPIDYYCCTSASQARQKRAAFPIVVSAQDPYPGHGKVDDVQTVYSNWTLFGARTYVLTSRSNDESLGTVSQNGHVVVAIPKENAYVSGWRLEPANGAKVSQNGNEFTVTEMTDNCCLTVEFRAKETAVVNYSVPEGCWKESMSCFIGDVFPLTPPEGKPVADAHHYAFLGWALETVADTAEEPVYLTELYVAEQPVSTLYALYTYTLDGVPYYTTELVMKSCPSARFADVPLNIWYHDAVDFVLENGLMNGVSDRYFEPDSQLTRGMLTTILYRMSGAPAGGSHPFTDVPDGLWYSNAVAWAYENQVVNGMDADTFAPDAAITRQQAATMLYRYARLIGADTSAAGDLSQFRDKDRIAPYAEAPMAWAVGAGMINGVGNGMLDPEGTATRAQIAKIIYEWLKNSQSGG